MNDGVFVMWNWCWGILFENLFTFEWLANTMTGLPKCDCEWIGEIELNATSQLRAATYGKRNLGVRSFRISLLISQWSRFQYFVKTTWIVQMYLSIHRSIINNITSYPNGNFRGKLPSTVFSCQPNHFHIRPRCIWRNTLFVLADGNHKWYFHNEQLYRYSESIYGTNCVCRRLWCGYFFLEDLLQKSNIEWKTWQSPGNIVLNIPCINVMF